MNIEETIAAEESKVEKTADSIVVVLDRCLLGQGG
jgi:hypothetical protein